MLQRLETETRKTKAKSLFRRKPSCGGRENVAALLLEEHDVESVKVRERATGLDGSALLGPAGLRPLLDDLGLLEELLDDGRAGTTGKTGDGELGQGKVLESERLTGDLGGGRVNDGLLV